jgi:chemotaxis protein MotA
VRKPFDVDKSSFAGLLLALGGILLGLTLEGGRVGQILQPTAALIVFGGTVGAVMIQFPLSIVLNAGMSLIQVFFDRGDNPMILVKEMVGYAQKARKGGIVSLDNELDSIDDPFIKKTLMLAVDGTEPGEIRSIMQLELDNQAEHEDNVPKVFESAGGFSPTVGIIGAVLGLIQVMQHLDNISEVGRGIAVAFVATIYGVGAANLFFLPAAGKLKIRNRERQLRHEIALEGVVSILEGMNPRMVETKLLSFVSETQQKQSAKTLKGAKNEPKKEARAFQP